MAEQKKTVSAPFRVSFPSLQKPAVFDGVPGKYEVTMLFKPADMSPAEKQQYINMKKLADLASREFFKKPLKELGNGYRTPFRKGTEDGKEKMDGYGEGVIFAKATTKQKPGVIDLDGNDLLGEGDVYAGCWARATLTAYGYNKVGNKGIAFGLRNVQKLKDGDSFSGSVAAQEEDWGDIPDDFWDGDEDDAPFDTEDDDFLD